MRFLALTFVLFCTLIGFSRPAAAAVEARVHIASQRMEVIVDGVRTGEYRVSTGKRGYGTPTGTFKPQRMHKTYYSHKYHNSPMPHSIFIVGGVALHGTNDLRHLGKPASHGCVRLDPRDAAALFEMVRVQGMQNTQVVISD
jgi:lipoprotein-anchoring transpeptidase ErfK/SrfK